MSNRSPTIIMVIGASAGGIEASRRIVFLATEQVPGAAMRSLRERAELCRQMASKAEFENRPAAAAWETAMWEAFDQADTVRQLLERKWTLPDGAGTLEVSAN